VRILAVSMHTSIHSEPPESPGIPARNGFNGFLRALLGDRLSCHRRLRNEFRQLERQRRGVRTTRLRRPPQALSSEAPSASTASRPAFVTIAKRPSIGTGRRINNGVSTEPRNEIFLQRGLDRKLLGSLIDLPVGQITGYSPVGWVEPFAKPITCASCN